MEKKLFDNLIESVKKNRKGLIHLKKAVVCCQQYELASALRDIEKEAFPESDEVKAAKEEAAKIKLVFQMLDMNISKDICWLLSETLREYKEKGSFSVDDAIRLRMKKEEIFLDE